MIVQLWEVSGNFDNETEQMCIGVKTEELAKQQTILTEVDHICSARVEVSEEENAELNSKGYIWL